MIRRITCLALWLLVPVGAVAQNNAPTLPGDTGGKRDLRSGSAAGRDILVRGDRAAPHRGVYEVVLMAAGELPNPNASGLRVTFTRPDGSSATVDGFYDGGRTYRARAYADQLGAWSWRCEADAAELDRKTGRFTVAASPLKGKLRIHPDDPYQFAYDDGTWFLHLGDTGYRYVVATEPHWQAYIDQAAEMGATKVRTWFCQARSTVEALFTEDRSALNLPYWQEIDRRVRYALEHHPDVQLQLIPYAEDTNELKRYAAGDPMARLIAKEAQARWSALPNVQWSISNDRELVAEGPMQGRQISEAIINAIARDMAAREPWETLLTNHQSRRSGYNFIDAPWSDIVTLEDLDEVGGALILEYRQKAQQPAVLDEDRYEYWRNPAHDRYFFRRLVWASLLSGGHATYGGLRTYEPYDGGPTRGVQGYFDANRAGVLEQGAHDFRHVHTFFQDSGLTMAGLEPDDAFCGGKPRGWKCAHDDDTYIIYLANPSGNDPATDVPGERLPKVTFSLPAGSFTSRWFNPSAGTWTDGESLAKGRHTLQPPAIRGNRSGDWVLLVRRTKGGRR